MAEALKSLSLKEWKLAIGGTFTSLASMAVAGCAAAVAVKWDHVYYATIPALTDMDPVCTPDRGNSRPGPALLTRA